MYWRIVGMVWILIRIIQGLGYICTIYASGQYIFAKSSLPLKKSNFLKCKVYNYFVLDNDSLQKNECR